MLEKKMSYKSIDRTLEEVRYVNNRYNPSLITFWDETFTANRRRLIEFCSKYNLPTKWTCDTRADSLDENKIIAMINGGCEHIGIGVECGTDASLEYIGKKESIATIERVGELLEKHSLKWKAYCIIGFPHETEDDIRKTIEFVKKIKPARIVLSFFTPYMGTSFYEECLQSNLITTDFDLAMFSHQSPHNHFCPKINKSTWDSLRKELSKEVDDYNSEAIKVWR